MIDFEHKRLIARLRAHPLIKKVRYHISCFDVTFTTGITERWRFNQERMRKNTKKYEYAYDGEKSDPVPIRQQFETEPDDPDADLKKQFPILANRDLKKACLVEQRLAVHQFVSQIASQWVNLWYPQSVLLEDLRRIQKERDWRHWSNGELHAVAALGFKNKGTPGRILLEHFNDLSELPGRAGTYRKGWNQARLYPLCRGLSDHGLDLTRSAVVRKLNYDSGYGPKIIVPGPYICMMRKYDIRPQAVADQAPGFGAKMIASAVLGAEEYASPNLTEELRQLGQFLGLKVGGLKRREYDVSFLDTDLQPLKKDPPSLSAYHTFQCVREPVEGIESFNVVTVPHALRRTRGIPPNIMLHHSRVQR